MPIYEFRCQSCDKVFDSLVMPSEKDFEMRCPECNSPEVTKLMSAASHTLGMSNFQSQPQGIQHRECASGNCATMTIPGRDRV